MLNRDTLRTLYRMEEKEAVSFVLSYLDGYDSRFAQHIAYRLITLLRKASVPPLQSVMSSYDLSSSEGVALMRLTESLLRAPDQAMRDALIKDQIGKESWMTHFFAKEGVYASCVALGLFIGSKIENNFIGRSILRQGMLWGVRFMGRQFIMGESIEETRSIARKNEKRRYAYSYDMLGEGATNSVDAQAYYDSYMHAIRVLRPESIKMPLLDAPGISVKLSALHARYEFSQRDRVHSELYDSIYNLVCAAKDSNMPIFIDAEESDRLELSLDLFERLAHESHLKGWDGLGLAIQAYQKRCIGLIDFLKDLARATKNRFLVRLVKGAYWDSEVKRAMELNLAYPVFTKKVNTDVSYLACAKRLLENPGEFYPCFATHNAVTQASIMYLASELHASYEFQKLHCMGDSLYEILLQNASDWPSCPDRVRVYAPVGDYERLLPYLVRRLLENGANSSFVNQVAHESIPIDDLVKDCVQIVKESKVHHHAHLLMPDALFLGRKNSQGLDIRDEKTVESFTMELNRVRQELPVAHWYKGEQINGIDIKSPIDHSIVGVAYPSTQENIREAMCEASASFVSWSQLDAKVRSDFLRKAADLFEKHMPDFTALLMDEAGKILEDCVSEVREAVDFLRYYAGQAELLFQPKTLPGITGESNRLLVSGRGVFFCISPWNFPLAIFIGQVSAALATGNTVLAKPAEQTPLVAHLAVQLLYQAGVPQSVLHLIIGKGSVVGSEVLSHPALSGVVFTGSTDTALIINRTLAQRTGAIVPFIAETGGQNAMIVDSSSLPEQVTRDVLTSAFRSAGQRCSALRVLFIQDDVYDKTLNMIKNAASELVVDDPRKISTDVGPVIDQQALSMLQEHEKEMQESGRLIFRVPLANGCPNGFFYTPICYEIDSLSLLKKETFGPFLHVIRYKQMDESNVLKEVEKTGYGLTLSIHSRLDRTVNDLIKNAKVGNIYVNRNQIGAVVEQQPFGGMGLSGTGPKAGGPHYLIRFIQEKTITINTSASGGDVDLLTMDDVES